ncbi:hypothetical protein AOLI_G00015910 [Acnodon oligacanthus]
MKPLLLVCSARLSLPQPPSSLLPTLVFPTRFPTSHSLTRDDWLNSSHTQPVRRISQSECRVPHTVKQSERRRRDLSEYRREEEPRTCSCSNRTEVSPFTGVPALPSVMWGGPLTNQRPDWCNCREGA